MASLCQNGMELNQAPYNKWKKTFIEYKEEGAPLVKEPEEPPPSLVVIVQWVAGEEPCLLGLPESDREEAPDWPQLRPICSRRPPQRHLHLTMT